MDENDVKLRERITAAENSLENLSGRVDRIDGIVASIREVVVELKQMRSDMNRIDRKVTDIESRPARRWESAAAAVIGAFAGGIGTVLFSRIFGG